MDRYVVTCNGVIYTGPLSREQAEKYAAMRRGDRKDLRRQGEALNRADNFTYGAAQRWEVVPA